MQWHGVPQGVERPIQRPSMEEGEAPKTPGTIVLAGIFLAAFAIYYFTNWKLLSLVWKIG